MISTVSISAVKASTSKRCGTGTSRRVAAAMEPMSAPMLNVFAVATMATAASSTGRGNRCLMSAASPLPVTSPSRAVDSWTAAARGRAKTVVQRRPNPADAPTCEYVAMPDGSSSAAPVTSPGPSLRKYPVPCTRYRCSW